MMIGDLILKVDSVYESVDFAGADQMWCTNHIYSIAACHFLKDYQHK